MRLTSPVFWEGEQIPLKYTKDGENIAPPLSWEGLPPGCKELALLFKCTTPSTQKPFTQWLVYGLSPEREELPEGLKHKRDPETPFEGVQGQNDIGNVGYDGPLGSAGKRMDYRFRLLALDRPLGLGPGAAPDAFDHAIKGHILDSASLICNHERPPA